MKSFTTTKYRSLSKFYLLLYRIKPVVEAGLNSVGSAGGLFIFGEV
jgi:hypothetical protein